MAEERNTTHDLELEIQTLCPVSMGFQHESPELFQASVMEVVKIEGGSCLTDTGIKALQQVAEMGEDACLSIFIPDEMEDSPFMEVEIPSDFKVETSKVGGVFLKLRLKLRLKVLDDDTLVFTGLDLLGWKLTSSNGKIEGLSLALKKEGPLRLSFPEQWWPWDLVLDADQLEQLAALTM